MSLKNTARKTSGGGGGGKHPPPCGLGLTNHEALLGSCCCWIQKAVDEA